MNPGKTLLFAPEWYWLLPWAERKKGRCGPGTSWKEKLVPENIWGLSMTPACQIHDPMYKYGKTIEDKREADRVFLNNMLRLIDAGSANTFMRWLRRRAAYKYYEAVDLGGGPAFWADKNKPEELG